MPSPTQINLEASASAVGPSQTATLTAEFARTPTGRGEPQVDVIEFRADDVVFASVPVDGGSSVSVETPPLETVTEFTAALVPQATAATDLPSTSNTVVVQLAAAGVEPTTTDLTVTPSTSTFGDTVTLSASVSAATGTPDGSVEFLADGTSLGIEPVVGGTASLTTASLPVGTYAIVANYLGTALYDVSDDSETTTVNVAPTPQLTLSGSASPNVVVAAGQDVALTFEISAPGGAVSDIVLSVPGATGITCPSTTLAAGASMTCTATYITSQADLAGDSFAITASVTGTGVAPVSTTIGMTARTNTVVESFEKLTNQFIGARARMVTGIALPGIFDRRRAPTGNRPGSIGAQADATSQTFSFSTSLEEWRAAGNAGSDMPLEPSRLNVWVDARLAFHGTEFGSRDWSRLGVAAGGVDYLLTDDLLVGIAAQADWMTHRTTESEFSGNGYLVGPYVSYALTDDISLDVALLYGQSSNQARSTVEGVVYTGDFETERLLATAGLTGFYEYEDFVFRPSAAFFLSSERSGAYTVSDPMGNQVVIPSQDILDVQLRGGITIERAIELENGATLTPMVGLNLTYGGALSDKGFEDRITGGIMGGLLYDFSGFSIKGSVEAEFGQDGFEGATGRISVNGRF